MKTREIKLFKYIGNGLCFTLLAGLVACGGENTTLDTTDAAAVETEVEDEAMGTTYDNENFNSNFTSTQRFGGWDANDDNMLDENEFNDSFFSTWDENDDNMLDENEWRTSANNFGMENQNWQDWDTNRDNNLDQNEFRTGMGKSNFRTEWDRNQDNMIDEREYSDGIFGQWDANNDNMLDDNEYNENYTRYYGS
ncbi:EF-hand domain-containing protein [Pontibacter akesuensis]|uniref:EF hand n=1 Tax=Pontibacter akesuensis TaxID=388950 RepID=A0A1I7GUG5_9BACT|nr:hypothetical protein [Pontibacter akesuensis]GHA55001.1 hypothetical protein GCM10007389_02950 [Pontibacter akesuensis]SFU52093.1 hypothetical protein SAMN04487941_1281 [Pontibacter akesuensis]